jgi:predicted metal-dependent HD superfamily phosphohydrolase
MPQIAEFLSHIGLPEVAINSVTSQYSTEGRHYHTVQHIEEMLSAFEKFKFLLNPLDHPTVKFAIIYHDFFCDPKRQDNEKRSAYYASGIIEVFRLKGIDPHKVESLMEATSFLQGSTLTFPQQFIRDIDRLILASEPVRFKEYEQQIRREYAHLSDETYSEGRANVLRQLWNEGRPYNLPVFNKLFQASVEANLGEIYGTQFSLV